MSKQKRKAKSSIKKARGWLILVLLAGAVLVFMLLAPSMKKNLHFSQSRSSSEGFIRAPQQKQDAAVALCENLVVERWLSWRHCRVVECSIYAKPAEGYKKQLEKIVKTNDRQIRDNLRTIISNADMNQLMDPRLAYVRRCTQHALMEISPEAAVDKILIPDWKTYRP